MLAARRALVTPKSSGPVAGMLAWYAADQITDPPSSGSALASWNDLSGNSYALTGTTGTEPTYETGEQNSLPAVAFNGTSYMLADPLLPNQPQPLTFYAAAQCAATDIDSELFGSSGVSFGVIDGRPFVWAAIVLKGGTIPGTAWLCMTVVADGAESLVRVNGIEQVSGNAGTQSLGSSATVGHTLPDNFWSGALGELLIYPTAHTTAQMQTNEQYLGNKWGIAT